MEWNKMKKIIVLSGIFLVVTVALVSVFLLVSDHGDSPDSCPPPPTYIFRLVNEDIIQSHSVSVIINDASNTTLAKESYSLDPGESRKSAFKMISENSTTTNSYFLICTVDDSVSSEIPVNVSYYAVPELHIDPTEGGVIYYPPVFTRDYACPLEEQTESADES